MIDPFNAMNDPFRMPDPFRLAQQPRPQQQPGIPPLTPEEEASLLESIGSGALGGLAYIGGALMKPGRAVRGLLGGKSREALNLIPFSDALGITDPAEQVHGTDLLGMSKDTPFFSADGLAGFGVDLLTDPLMYMGFGAGALTKAGKAAQKLGVLPKAISGATGSRVSGLAAGSVEADALARSLAGLAPGAPLTAAQAALGTQKLGGHVGIGLPFGGNAATLDLSGIGSGIASVAGAIPGAAKAGQFIADTTAPLRRGLGAMFNQPVMGQPTVKGQELGRMLFKEKNAGKLDALENVVAPIVRAYGDDALTDFHGMRELIEQNLGPAHHMKKVPSAGAAAAAKEYLKHEPQVWQEMVDAGIDVGQFKGHFFRQAVEPGLDVARPGVGGVGGAFAPTTAGALARVPFLETIPAETINAMVMDPFIGTTKRLAGKDSQAATQAIVMNYGLPSGQAKQVADWLWSLHEKRLKIGFFSKHNLDDATAGFVGAKEAAATGHTMAKFAAQNAMADAGPGSKTVLEVFKEIGLNSRAVANAAAHLPGATAGQVGSMHLSREVADAMIRATRPFAMPETIKPVIDVIDNITNLTKSWLTQAFPSYHMRNRVSEAWQNYVLLGLKDLPKANSWAKGLIAAKPIQGAASWDAFRGMNITDDAASKKIADWAFAHGVTGSHVAQDVVGQAAGESILMRVPGLMKDRKTGVAAVGQFLKDVASPTKDTLWPHLARGVGGRGQSENWLLKAGEKLSTEGEHVSRLTGFIGLLKQGYMPEVAAAMSKAAHVDYAALTTFEREAMRRLIPFYAWSRKNIPWQIKNLLENPGGPSANMIKATALANENPGFTPPYLGQGVAAPIGAEENGTQRFLSQLGLPFEELGNLSVRGIAGMANPTFKFPYETFSGQQTFSGRNLEDAHSRLGELGVPILPTGENLLMNSPASRFITTAGTLVDKRKTPLDKALNLLTGMRVTDVDMNRARLQAARRHSENLLMGAPGVRRFENLSVTPEVFQALPPELQDAVRLYRSVQRPRR